MLKLFHPALPSLASTDTGWPARLGAFCFAAQTVAPPHFLPPATPCAQIFMPPLGGADSAWQYMQGESGTHTGRQGDLLFRHDDHLLFGVMTLDEAHFTDRSDAASGTPLQSASRHAYDRIFDVMQDTAFPYLLRCWNYFADINGVSHGLERYRQFNLGRQQAFEHQPPFIFDHPPAACALGTQYGPLTIAFLAARSAPIPVDNPRQIKPRDYPPEYGPRSPLFSRACLFCQDDRRQFFLSGTASIAGHRTLHAGDAVGQAEETMRNIRAVLDAAHVHGGEKIAIDAPEYIVYIRHAAHLPLIRASLEKQIGSNLKALYLQADICRADLLLEIEAYAGN